MFVAIHRGRIRLTESWLGEHLKKSACHMSIQSKTSRPGVRCQNALNDGDTFHLHNFERAHCSILPLTKLLAVVWRWACLRCNENCCIHLGKVHPQSN